MNLWAKRSIRQLAVLAVALFFFSCEDETSLLGFKNQNPKFKITYAEIPIASSVLLLDSLRTSNFYLANETNRLLVGKYTDDKFGAVTSVAYTQYFTTNLSKSFLSESAKYDSVSIQLRFDFYYYGETAISNQQISIYELDEELKRDSTPYYFNKSNTLIKPTAIATKSFSINPAEFQKYIDDKKDTAITVHMPAELEFGRRIFENAVKYRNSTVAADSSFARYSEFVKEFKGIAIVPDAGDKILGFSALSSASRITLHYHDDTADSLQLNLTFAGRVSYNKINSDRSTTELAGLIQEGQEFEPANMRYIQSGTGILTKLDFSQFYAFADADTNQHMIINSAQLIINNVEPVNQFKGIDILSLKVLTDDNHIKKIADSSVNMPQYLADIATLNAYKGFLTSSIGQFTVVGEPGELFTMQRSSVSDPYAGFLTLFAQQMFNKDSDKPRYKYFALYPESPQILRPESPQIGKSVNRLVFDKNNIKLRIYYTRPTSTENSN